MIGLRPWEVYEFTPREFSNYSKGVLDRMKSEQRSDWERTRWLGWVFAQPYDTKGKFPTPQDLLPLEGEQKNTKERRELANKLFRKYL